MANDDWIQLILALLGLGLTITLSLLGILFSWLKSKMDNVEKRAADDLRVHSQQNEDRFRSVYHELRDNRSKTEGLYHILIDVLNKTGGRCDKPTRDTQTDD